MMKFITTYAVEHKCFEVLTGMTVKSAVFWVVTPRSSERSQQCELTNCAYRLLLLVSSLVYFFYPEDVGGMFILNIGATPELHGITIQKIVILFFAELVLTYITDLPLSSFCYPPILYSYFFDV
jgi:hypothetical protein